MLCLGGFVKSVVVYSIGLGFCGGVGGVWCAGMGMVCGVWRYEACAVSVGISWKALSRASWGSVSKPLGSRLEASWGLFWASWGLLGRLLDLLGASWEPFGGLLGPLGCFLEPPGAVLGRKARISGSGSPSLALLEAVCEPS